MSCLSYLICNVCCIIVDVKVIGGSVSGGWMSDGSLNQSINDLI